MCKCNHNYLPAHKCTILFSSRMHLASRLWNCDEYPKANAANLDSFQCNPHHQYRSHWAVYQFRKCQYLVVISKYFRKCYTEGAHDAILMFSNISFDSPKKRSVEWLFWRELFITIFQTELIHMVANYIIQKGYATVFVLYIFQEME